MVELALRVLTRPTVSRRARQRLATPAVPRTAPPVAILARWRDGAVVAGNVLQGRYPVDGSLGSTGGTDGEHPSEHQYCQCLLEHRIPSVSQSTADARLEVDISGRTFAAESTSHGTDKRLHSWRGRCSRAGNGSGEPVRGRTHAWSGGHGFVAKAVDQTSGQPVAVKRLLGPGRRPALRGSAAARSPRPPAHRAAAGARAGRPRALARHRVGGKAFLASWWNGAVCGASWRWSWWRSSPTRCSPRTGRVWSIAM